MTHGCDSGDVTFVDVATADVLGANLKTICNKLAGCGIAARMPGVPGEA